MKALTSRQPWASLCITALPKTKPLRAIKSWETRSWKPGKETLEQIRREGFLLHSSLRFAAEEKRIADLPPFKKHWPLLDPWSQGRMIGHLTIGRIITTDEWRAEFKDTLMRTDEYIFGDYSPGRYAYELTSFKKFDTAVRVVGSLSFWDMDERICLQCGCMDHDCSGCIEKTGHACEWILPNLCSRCEDEIETRMMDAEQSAEHFNDHPDYLKAMDALHNKTMPDAN